MKFVFATNNNNKLLEVNHLLSGKFEILSLKDINCNDELPETHDTVEENALEKADFIYRNFKKDCFAEDTGLFIEELNGEPGVYSARYAGLNKSAADNICLVLEKMKGKKNRFAYFKTVISLIVDGKNNFFTGILNGKIAENISGLNGFGYDPVFIPEGLDTTFAEMNLDEKNKISHRSKAFMLMKEFLS